MHIVMQHLTISLLVIFQNDRDSKRLQVRAIQQSLPPEHSVQFATRQTLEFLDTMAIPAIGNGRPKRVS